MSCNKCDFYDHVRSLYNQGYRSVPAMREHVAYIDAAIRQACKDMGLELECSEYKTEVDADNQILTHTCLDCGLEFWFESDAYFHTLTEEA